MSTSISSGIIYTAISKYSNVFISLIVSAVLARLISPDEFGIVAVVLVFVTFFNLLSDFGIGPAIIQNKELDDNDIISIFSFSVLLGAFFSFVFLIGAPYIANFYNNQALLNVTRWLSLSILFFSLNVVPNSLLLKKLKFKQVGLIGTAVQIVTGTIAIILAHKGASYYALVIKSILDGFLLFIACFYLNPIRITIRVNRGSIRKIARFSGYQFLFNFINYFSRNADSLLIGKYFGSSALGFYDRSYRLMMMPVQNLTHVITPVLLPVLSGFQDDKKRIFKQYLKIVIFLSIIGFPLSIFLFFAAPEIIQIVYGSMWKNSIPIFKLLAITVGIQVVLSSSGSIFQVINRTDLLFKTGLLSSVFMVGGISYGVFYVKSLEGVAVGLIVAFIISFFQNFYVLIHIGLKSSFIAFLRGFLFSIIISIGMFIALQFLTPLVGSTNVYYILLFKVIISSLVFASIILGSAKYRKLLMDKIKLKRIQR